MTKNILRNEIILFIHLTLLLLNLYPMSFLTTNGITIMKLSTPYCLSSVDFPNLSVFFLTLNIKIFNFIITNCVYGPPIQNLTGKIVVSIISVFLHRSNCSKIGHLGLLEKWSP